MLEIEQQIMTQLLEKAVPVASTDSTVDAEEDA